MRKKLIGVAVVATIAVAAGWNYNQSKNEVGMSELAFANVEALASNEGDGKCRWGTREVSGGWEAICIVSGVGYTCSCGEVKPPNKPVE